MKVIVKEVPAAVYLIRNYKTTVSEIPEIAGRDLGPLEEAALAASFEIAGDATFFYFDCTGEMDKEFHFAIGFPVVGAAEVEAPYELRAMPDFNCLAADYIGGMPGIGEAWNQMHAAVSTGGYRLQGESREVYKKWVDFESAENVTELQVGVS